MHSVNGPHSITAPWSRPSTGRTTAALWLRCGCGLYAAINARNCLEFASFDTSETSVSRRGLASDVHVVTVVNDVNDGIESLRIASGSRG